MSAPKLFISYCWSSTEREEWVLALATTLRQAGIDAILDKWDLKEGQDANAFMESMVNDPDVTKVIMVCDETYARKADGRKGGVGTETQIISAQVYQSQKQEKFVAVLAERSPEGHAHLPTYYLSRKYIDLSSDDLYSQNLEHLIRWAFDKPLYMKPELGAAPAFLDAGSSPQLGTTAQFLRAKDAIKGVKPHALSAFDDYLNAFVSKFETFRVNADDCQGHFDEHVLLSIEEFLPFRNEFIALVGLVCETWDAAPYGTRMQRFFERLAPFLNYSGVGGSYRSWDFDNFRFIVHELFLYAVALGLKSERFDFVRPLVDEPYYKHGDWQANDKSTATFAILWESVESLEHRNSRLSLNRRSVWADLLNQRAAAINFDFNLLMQADLMLFVRSRIESDSGMYWFPITLIYVNRRNRAFEIFARCVSRKYLSELKPLIGTDTVDTVTAAIAPIEQRAHQMLGWFAFSLDALLGLKDWASRP